MKVLIESSDFRAIEDAPVFGRAIEPESDIDLAVIEALVEAEVRHLEWEQEDAKLSFGVSGWEAGILKGYLGVQRPAAPGSPLAWLPQIQEIPVTFSLDMGARMGARVEVVWECADHILTPGGQRNVLPWPPNLHLYKLKPEFPPVSTESGC